MNLSPSVQDHLQRLLKTAAVVILAGLIFALCSCASKTPPEFLQNASAGLFGGIITDAATGAMMRAPAPSKPNGFATFYGGGGE